MKRTISFFICLSLLFAWLTGCAPAPKTADLLSKLHWFGTSAILYNGSKVIYFDPVSLDGKLPQADLILVTHAHSDHWSVADLKKIIGPHTTLIIGPNVASNYEAAKADLGIPATVLNEGDSVKVDGVTVKAVPAYDTTYHPKGSGGVGFLVSLDGITLYHTGGTEAHPEMANYKCDIAFVPVYSKDGAQAMAKIIPARVIILEHTSYYAAQAVADLFTKDIGGGKQFLALEAGPYNP
ncbi:MAG TPA: MBL fold metallo-hydrolase [Anaerolineales bacterium]|nr:MBL fold metallo-hydrolase [Anaerolineales bacterium]